MGGDVLFMLVLIATEHTEKSFRRARALGVGLLSGGYGQDELERAGAYRVYQDPADLMRHLGEVGVRSAP
jgi:phosphoglycolate phosphatase-like HAD superfamily hydrolase